MFLETRIDNVEWFSLADEACDALVELTDSAMKSVKTGSWDPVAIMVRILLRATGNCQGAILMAERGMTAEARILVRSLIEAAFCVAALHECSRKFIEMLRKDSEASKQQQRKFVINQNLVEDMSVRAKIKEVIDAAEKGNILSPKKVAELGPLLKQYLVYQRLSDDAGHVSARSLDRHVQRLDGGWCYAAGPASKEVSASTLYYLVLSVMPIGIAASEILKDYKANSRFSAVAGRFQAMPNVGAI